MDTMALRTLAFPYRLMLPGKRGLILFMTLDTERIGILSGLGKIRPGPVMATFTLTGNNRLMHHRLQQALLVAGMGVMTTQTIPLQKIPLVRFAHGFLAALVTLETKAVRFLYQQKRIFALMGSMAGNTSLAEWSMDILFLILNTIMASVTNLFLLFQQQSWIGGVMACVAGGAVPFSHRIVDGNRARLRRNGLMAAETQIRFILP